jgi:flagellar biosynthesis/type III secretory pathway protein FliH
VQLNQLQKLPELIITVNPQNLKKIRAACKRLISQNNLKIQIHIKQSEKLELSDCKINWETGYIEKKLKNILDNLSSVTFELNNEPITE